MIAHSHGPARRRNDGTADGDAQATARLHPCSACHARPGVPCQTIPEDGDHLARYCDAEKKGALTRRQLAAVIGRLDVIARWVIVAGRATADGRSPAPRVRRRRVLRHDRRVCSCCWADKPHRRRVPARDGVMTTRKDSPGLPGSRLFAYTEYDADGAQVRRVVTDRLAGGEGKPGTLLLIIASGLLLLLAAGQGAVSWAAQYGFVRAAKHAVWPSALEALGLDVAAVIFALLALALVRLGRPARIERALNLACAAGSLLMNVLAADLGSPRSIAIYALPSALYAACSDRLIAVAARHAAGPDAGGSMWHAVGRGLVYATRFLLAPPSTARGLRRAVLAAAPLPDPAAGTGDSAPVPVPEAYPPAVPGAGYSRNGHGPQGAAQAAQAFAADLDAGKIPSVRRIRLKAGCGQDRARQIQHWLRARHAGTGGGVS